MNANGQIVVLHVFHHVRVSGGAEKHVRDLLCTLETGGAIKPLLALMDPSEGTERHDLESVKVLPFHGRDPDSRWWTEHAFACNVLKAVRRHNVDIIHTHAATEHRLCVPAAAFTRIPLIRTQHTPAREKDTRTGLATPLLRLATRKWLAVSPDVADSLRTLYGVRKQAIHTIANGIDVDAFRSCPLVRDDMRRSLGIPKSRFVLISVSRLLPTKAVPVLVRAFAQARREEPNMTLLIVGDGQDRERIEQTIADCHIGADVKMLGLRADVPKLLSAADAFATASRYEGCPIAPIEAMAAGLPVIGTEAPGMRFVIDHEQSGFALPVDTPEAHARAMVQLKRNGRLRARMGESALRRARTFFSLEGMATQYASFYEGLIGRPRRRGNQKRSVTCA